MTATMNVRVNDEKSNSDFDDQPAVLELTVPLAWQADFRFQIRI